MRSSSRRRAEGLVVPDTPHRAEETKRIKQSTGKVKAGAAGAADACAAHLLRDVSPITAVAKARR